MGDYIDDTLSRAERIKQLYNEDAKKPGSVESMRRRAQLENEYIRESPSEPLRNPVDQAIRGGS